MPYGNIDALRELLAEAGLETGGTGSKVRPVVSCKGTTCQYGLLDSYALSDKIHEMFYHGYAGVKLPHKFKIAVGGCPNNCVKPNLNDLGIVGQRIPQFNSEICRGCKVCQVEKILPDARPPLLWTESLGSTRRSATTAAAALESARSTRWTRVHTAIRSISADAGARRLPTAMP